MTGPVLELTVPRTHPARRAYAARVVVGEFLGLEHVIRQGDAAATEIRLVGDCSPRRLTVADGFFAQDEATWLTPASLPREPLASRNAGAELPGARLLADRLPVLFEGGGALLRREADGRSRLALDVFGTAFFALTRYEEAVASEPRDEHGRFPAHASLAARAGFLHRPLVDEHVAVLRAALLRVWPRLPLPTPRSAVWLTHDVDRPLVAVGRPRRELARSLVADAVLRRSAGLAWRRLASSLTGAPARDPGDTFDFLMDVAESAGLRACFNVLAGGTTPRDGSYRLGDPWIRSLLRRIAARGHELGFHGSYASFDAEERIAAEFGCFRATAAEIGVEQAEWGGRQHFLRWANPQTWRAWSAAGLRHDSSVYFAEQPGFRAGTCRPYPVFDVVGDRELPLVERPLTLMDVSATRYLRLGARRTLELAARLAHACRTVGGTFVLLWHNDAALTPASRRLYRELVETIT